MKQTIPRSPFATSLSGSAKEAELRIRSIFQWKKLRPPVWLMALVALTILGCCGLVSCQPREQEAEIAMELQYYDEYGNYIEVPTLTPPEGQEANEAIQAINQELGALAQEYRSLLEDPITRMEPGTKCLFYPSETDRYLNLVLYQQPGNAVSSGIDLASWVYDKEADRRVTLEDALALAGTDRKTLEAGLLLTLEEKRVYDFNGDHISFPLGGKARWDIELLTFRLCSGDEVEFYLHFQDEFAASHFFTCRQGEYRLYPTPHSDTTCIPLIPAAETAPMSPALWNQWYFGEGQPQGGFDAPPLTQTARAILLAREGLIGFDLHSGVDVTVPLSRTIGSRTLMLVRVTGMPHAAGLDNLVLGVWDEEAQSFLQPIYPLGGDRGLFIYWEEGGGLTLLCSNSTTYQGWETGGGIRYFRFDEDGLTQLTTLPDAAKSFDLPLPEDAVFLDPDHESGWDYWADHKVLPAPGGVELFERNPRWSNIGPTDEVQWEYLGYLPFSWDSTAFAPAVEGLRPYLEEAAQHPEIDPQLSAQSLIINCTFLGDARGSAENWRLATATSLDETAQVDWYAVTVNRNTGAVLEIRPAQEADASVPWEELDSPANIALRDQLILDWLNDDPDYLHHYLPGTVPEQPVEDNTVRIDEIRYLGEAVTYETTGVAYRVTRSIWQNRRESDDDPGTLGWHELYPVTVVLSRSGYTGELEDVRGDALYEEGKDVTDLIDEITYRLYHAQVSLLRDGYPAPVGIGSQITFHREVNDGPMEVEEIEGWDLYGWPGAYWAWHRWEGFAARCYHPGPDEGVDPSIQYSIGHIETTRTDLFTSRGIRVGSTRAEVREAYPTILTGDYWGLYPEEEDMLIFLPLSGHDPGEVTDMAQIEFYSGLGPALLFFFDGDTVRQIVLTNMHN